MDNDGGTFATAGMTNSGAFATMTAASGGPLGNTSLGTLGNPAAFGVIGKTSGAGKLEGKLRGSPRTRFESLIVWFEVAGIPKDPIRIVDCASFPRVSRFPFSLFPF